MKREDASFRDKLAQHQSKVELEELWGAIEPRIDQLNEQHRRRRRLFFWLPGLLGGILLLGFALWPNRPKVGAGSEAPWGETARPTASELATDHLKPSPAAEAEPSLAAAEVPATPSAGRSPQGRSSEQPLGASLASPRFSGREKPQVPTTMASKRVSPAQELGAASLSGSTEEDDQGAAATALPMIAEATNASRSVVVGPDASRSNRSRLDGPLATLDRSIPALAAAPLTLEEPASAAPRDLIRRRRRQERPSLSLEIYGGLAYAAKSWQANDEVLLQQRQATERALETSRAGILAEFGRFNGWSLATGIQRTQINERFDYQDRVVEVEMTTGLQRITVLPDGDTLKVFGEVPLTRTFDIRQRIYNRYTMYDVPLLLGYARPLGDWLVGGQVGWWTNLSLRTEGQIQDQTLENIRLPEEAERVYVERMGWSCSLGVHVDRSWGDHWSIRLAANAHYYPARFNQEAYRARLSEQYTVLGLQLGLRYRLGR